MLALPPTTQPALPLLSTIARLLSSDRSFAARISDLFVLLREAVAFHDGRLVCWLQSAHASGLREQFYTPNGWQDAWNDELTRQVVQHGSAVRLTMPLLAAAIAVEGGAGDVTTLPLHAGELTGQQEQSITLLRAELEAPLSLNELLTLLLRWALDSTGAEAGAISLVDHERAEIVLHVYEGYRHEPYSNGELYSAPRRRISWENGL